MINKQFNQSGLALVSVLFITALVVTIITAISHRQTLDIQLTSNLVFRTQAFQYLKAMEVYSIDLLQQDFSDNGTLDSYNDDWYQYGLAIPLDDGVFAEAELWDIQGLYNVNNLVDNNFSAVQAQQDYLERLFQQISTNNTSTIEPEITQSIVDWIDIDDLSTGLGSEEGDYLVKTPAYRTANYFLSDVDELNLIEGVDFEVFNQIKDLLTALPTNSAKINVNFAPKEILMAIHPNVDESEIDNLIQDRTTAQREEDREFTDVASFLAHPAFAGLSNPAPSADNYQVHSNYFLLKARITLGDRVVQMHSVLYRDDSDGSTRVLTRNLSKRFNPVKPIAPIT